MKHLVLLFLVASLYAAIDAELCSRPYLTRVKVNIYTTSGKVPVRISRCLFNDTKDAYSDISDNCVKAFHSGVFTDKWSQDNVLADKGSPIVLEEYVSKADLIKNEVNLRSGDTCRYDRGFCYDPTETNTYAIVWDLLDKAVTKCPAQLYKVFEGDVDIWHFKAQDLRYLFYYDALTDEAFYLSLSEKGNCQDTDVWYTEDGYMVSLKPLVAKSVETKATLKIPTKSVKGGTKGRLTAASSTKSQGYFYYRTKKVVSENILKNCDIKTLTIKEISEIVKSDYLDDPNNLHLILDRIYRFIVATRQELIEIIESQNTVKMVAELREKIVILAELLDKTRIEVKEIQEILLAAGNLNGIRVDVDKLAAQLALLLARNEEYDAMIEKIWVSIKLNSKTIGDQGLLIEQLSEKLAILQNTINTQLLEYITKTEVYDKINQVEQNFHKKLRDLALNVTMLILQQESGTSSGVRGGAKARAEVETLILDKLNSFNVERVESSIEGLREKVERLVSQVRFESYSNLTSLEERILKKLADLAAKNEPILARLDEDEKRIDQLFSQIKDVRSEMQKYHDDADTNIQEVNTKITKIFNTFNDYENQINKLKQELTDLSNKEIDFTPAIEKSKYLIAEALKPINQRLDTVETVSVKLTEDVQREELEIENLSKKIEDIIEALKTLDSLKGDIADDVEKEVSLIKKQLKDVDAPIEGLIKKQEAHANELQSARDTTREDIERLGRDLLEYTRNLNISITDNTGLIYKLQDQFRQLSDLVNGLKKNLGDQKDSINTLEIYVKDKSATHEASNQKNSDLIDILKANVSELYDTVKKHEDLILTLKKNYEKLAANQRAKGKTNAYTDQQTQEEWGQQGQQELEDYDGGYGSYTKTTKTLVSSGIGGGNDHSHIHGGGSYGRSSSSRVQTESTTILIERQQQEISVLRSQLAQAHSEIDNNEHRIDHLETKLEQLVKRIANTELVLSSDIKTLNGQISDLHEEVVHLESDTKDSIFNCCGSQAYTSSSHGGNGVKTKSSYVSTKSTYSGIKH